MGRRGAEDNQPWSQAPEAAKLAGKYAEASPLVTAIAHCCESFGGTCRKWQQYLSHPKNNIIIIILMEKDAQNILVGRRNGK